LSTILGTSATGKIAWVQKVVPALFYGVKQHCLLSRYPQLRANGPGQARPLRQSEIDPHDALEARFATGADTVNPRWTLTLRVHFDRHRWVVDAMGGSEPVPAAED